MSAKPTPKLDLSKLVFKIEAIKLKLDNPPKSGKISVTLRASKKDNTLDENENGGFAKGRRQKVNSEMEWEMNSDVVVDTEGTITVDIKEHHRTKPLSAKSLVSNPISLRHEVIFDKFVKSDMTGDVQEFALPGSGLTVTLCISAFSLDSILKTFIPPKSLVSKLGKYQAGLDVILQMATALGGLNTTAGAVIGAATQAFEVLKNQEKCHQDILNLFEHMGIILSIIADAGPLKEHFKIIEEVINSTLTCIKGAVEQVLIKCQDNMLKQLIFSSELADKISHFRSEFDDLKEQYKLVLAQVTALLTLSAEHTRTLTEKLRPQSHEGFKVCMEGTRVALLSKLVEHIKRGNIVWLHGLAGTGKSCIMGSLEQKFHKTPVDPDLTGIELAMSFHCTRGTRSEDLHILVPTVAYNIARKFPAFGRYLADDPQLTTSGGLHYQFNNLLHRPLEILKNERNVSPTSQILVIIDALDEWALEEESREQFLKETQELCKNHNWLKFVITSRPNPEIREAFAVGQHLEMDVQQDPNIQNDIAKFLRQCIKGKEKVDKALTKADEEWLLSYVESLFILADTAFKFLAYGLDPREKLAIMRKQQGGSKSGANSYNVLYDLYTTVLKEAIQDPDNDTTKYLKVIGTLIILQRPITENALRALTGDYALDVVKSLGAVFYKGGDGKLKYHLSFKEFIQKEGDKRGFYINLKDQHRHLTDACLEVLRTKLKFNICQLDDSGIPNDLVSNPDLTERVAQHISEELQYSCENWVHHLCETEQPQDTMLAEVVKLMTGRKIVYWMECLSLMGKTSQIRDSMESLSDRRMCEKLSPTIMEMADEIGKCVKTFYYPIAHSTPHLYVSVLPMIPENTVLYQNIHKYMDNVIRIKQEGKYKQWVSEITQIPHDKRAFSVSYSPNGEQIASGSEDGTVRIWNAETGQPVGKPLKGHSGYVQSVAYSPDGKHIVSGSQDQTLRIWNTETRQPVGEPLKSHTGAVNSVAYSPDGKYIVSGSQDQTLRIWNAETRQPVGEPLKGHTSYVLSVAYSPDKKHIVSGSGDHTLRIWNTETGKSVGEPLNKHTIFIWSVAYSPDGKYIVSGSGDKTLRIWYAETGQPVGEPLKGHADYVRSVVYSPDGKYIVSGSDDLTLRIWNAETGQPVGEPLKGHTNWVQSVAYSPDGKHIVSGSYDQTLRIWNAETGQPVGEPVKSHTDFVRSVAYSPDGTHIVSGSDDQTLRIWNAQTGELVGEPLKGHTGWVQSVAYSPDGKHIVSGSDDLTLRIWDAETGEAVGKPLQSHTDFVQSVAYSPDGKHIVSGSDDHTLTIWNAATGQPVGEPLKGHTDWVQSVAYSPGGQYIVSGSDDLTLRLWNAQTGQPVGEPLKGHTGWVQSVAYSPHGKYIVSGSDDQTLRIWNTETRQPVGEPLKGHTARVQSVAYSPDGKHIVSGSHDLTLRIWDAETGQQVGEPLKGHIAYVCSVAYSPDQKYIVSGSQDQILRIWNAETGQLVDGPSPDNLITLLAGHSSASLNHPGIVANRQGWVILNTGYLLFWLLPQYRFGAADSRQVLTLPSDAANQAVNIDYSNFIYGKDWERSWKTL